MRTLILMVLLLLPFTAMAEESMPWWVNPSSSITSLPVAPGTDYLYNSTGQSATIIQVLPGLSWYSAQDHPGHIASQGYVYAPFATPAPLHVPPSMSVPSFMPPSLYQSK